MASCDFICPRAQERAKDGAKKAMKSLMHDNGKGHASEACCLCDGLVKGCDKKWIGDKELLSAHVKKHLSKKENATLKQLPRFLLDCCGIKSLRETKEGKGFNGINVVPKDAFQAQEENTRM